MSTTVSYKGDTIATVNNSTKVLETGGTWLEDDITLVDVTGGGGTAVIESLSVTQNGTYTAPSGVDGYSPITVNVSGGGGGLSVIETINVTAENGKRIDIDSTWFNTYDYVIIVPDIIFSASDWLYFTNDATSGGNYTDSIAGLNKDYVTFINFFSNLLVCSLYKGSNRNTAIATVYPTNYLYYYLYGSSHTMTGTFTVYGVTL